MNELERLGAWALSSAAQYLLERLALEPAVDSAKRNLQDLAEKIRRRRLVINPDLSARVAVKALEEAWIADGDMVQEYLAGILAATGTSDDGVSSLAQLSRLSTFHIRLHYVLYRACRRVVDDSALSMVDLRQPDQLISNMRLAIPTNELMQALALADEPVSVEYCMSALDVLAAEDLVSAFREPQWGGGPGASPYGFVTASDRSRPQEVGYGRFGHERILSFQPTPRGISFLLWAVGSYDVSPIALRRVDYSALRTHPAIPDCDGVFLLR